MSEKKVTSFVCTVDEEKIALLRDLLETRGWTFSEVPYAHWKATGDKVNVVAYCSGKLTVQGGGTADFVSFILEPEVLHTFTFGYEEAVPAETNTILEPVDPHGGVDESGKGDFFGPLVVSAVFVTPETGDELRKIGVCDSKLIKSSKKILELSSKIRMITQGTSTVVTLPPESYNRVYAQIGNLNRLLAWGHARAIENLLEKVPACPRVLCDKFANEVLIQRALMTRGRTIELNQRTKAESDVAVAAASILAREGFLKGMEKLSAEFGVEFPRGAGTQVRAVATQLFQKHGKEVFARCAKLHFKTYHEVTGEGEIF